ncbi:FUSC family protein [Streptomyces sp. ODS28]|uniref:FUSC family protein n=1 Tax=Streptomyces sp. ODS28 TaxID=3136688 RepID=UPI0031EE1D76
MKKVFIAPDPGRLRLRVATRAVLGIGLAVTAAALAGMPLDAVITAGLVALLALFTVADPTVRGQALSTALFPAAGFPALALAAALHGYAPARDAAFLLVVFCGAYARRWGPRGNALGIYAFMNFFAAQFLHSTPAQLPLLYAASALALAAAALVRFALWPIERRTPPPAQPAPQAASGLRRPSTRLAWQVTAASALALAAGQLLSPDRWYWAVGATWWIFVNTASRGETLVRGFRRVLGTVTGIAAGLLIAVPLDGATWPTAAVAAVCVFGIFYSAPLSYSWMMFFVTVLVGVLYGLLGVLHPGLLALRIQETAVGALGAVLAVAVVLPVTTHQATDAWIRRAVHCVHDCTREAARRIAGDESADPAPRIAELELLLGRVRMSLAPLVHPLSPLRARKARARTVLALLDDCARQVRGLAGVAADPYASHDARLTAACERVEAAVHGLVSPQGLRGDGVRREAAARLAEAPGAAAHRSAAHRTAAHRAEGHPAHERALAHLHGLETALGALAAPVHSEPGAPLTAA